MQYKTVYLTIIDNKSKVTVEYVDENGNQVAENVVYAGNVGENYTTEQKAVTGYTFKEVKGNQTGTFTEEEQSVTYVYTKSPAARGTVMARYVDEDGNSIADNMLYTGSVGESYKTEKISIDGYTYIKTQGNSKGTFIEENQTVTYVYKINKKEINNTVDSSDNYQLSKKKRNNQPKSVSKNG